MVHKDPWAALGAVHLFQKEDTRRIEQAADSCAVYVCMFIVKERKGRNKRTRTAFYIDWLYSFASAQTTLDK